MIDGYDAIDIGLIPRNTQAVVCYWDGLYVNYNEAIRQFPELAKQGRILPLSGAHGFSDPAAPGTDIEPGNAGTETAVPFVRRNVHPRPCIYAARDDMLTIVANLHTAGFPIGLAGPPRLFRLFVAHPSGVKHICGPTTCGYPIEADATQWAFNPGGVNIDADVFRDDFFSTQPVPHPPKEENVIIVTERLADGRIALFVGYSDTGEVFHTWQAKEGGWTGAQAGKRLAGWAAFGDPRKNVM